MVFCANLAEDQVGQHSHPEKGDWSIHTNGEALDSWWLLWGEKVDSLSAWVSGPCCHGCPTTMVVWAAHTVGIKQIGGHEMGVGWRGGVDLVGVIGRSWDEHYNTLNEILK